MKQAWLVFLGVFVLSYLAFLWWHVDVGISGNASQKDAQKILEEQPFDNGVKSVSDHRTSMSTASESSVRIEAIVEKEKLVTEDAAEEAATGKAPEPAQQQQEAMQRLEQKINGQINVTGPLLPEILKSEEYASLTRQQKNKVAHSIIERLNKGELKPEDVYP